MNDDNMIERYSMHLNKILYKYQDVFIKSKYNAYLEMVNPKQEKDFFERMKVDKQKRDERQQERELEAQRSEAQSRLGLKIQTSTSSKSRNKLESRYGSNHMLSQGSRRPSVLMSPFKNGDESMDSLTMRSP